jgi:hypothetical protein
MLSQFQMVHFLTKKWFYLDSPFEKESNSQATLKKDLKLKVTNIVGFLQHRKKVLT